MKTFYQFLEAMGEEIISEKYLEDLASFCFDQGVYAGEKAILHGRGNKVNWKFINKIKEEFFQRLV